MCVAMTRNDGYAMPPYCSPSPTSGTQICYIAAGACNFAIPSSQSDDYDYVICVHDPNPPSCLNPYGADTPHGGNQWRTRYQSHSVVYPNSCNSQSQSRSCTYGWWSNWSGSSSYSADSCSVVGTNPTCNNGYADVTNGNAFAYPCASGCAGGQWADSDCNCACAMDHIPEGCAFEPLTPTECWNNNNGDDLPMCQDYWMFMGEGDMCANTGGGGQVFLVDNRGISHISNCESGIDAYRLTCGMDWKMSHCSYVPVEPADCPTQDIVDALETGYCHPFIPSGQFCRPSQGLNGPWNFGMSWNNLNNCYNQNIYQMQCDCDWIPVSEEYGCVGGIQNLNDCHVDMYPGELCEADTPLPNGAEHNIDNCESYDVFRYTCGSYIGHQQCANRCEQFPEQVLQPYAGTCSQYDLINGCPGFCTCGESTCNNCDCTASSIEECQIDYFPPGCTFEAVASNECPDNGTGDSLPYCHDVFMDLITEPMGVGELCKGNSVPLAGYSFENVNNCEESGSDAYRFICPGTDPECDTDYHDVTDGQAHFNKFGCNTPGCFWVDDDCNCACQPNYVTPDCGPGWQYIPNTGALPGALNPTWIQCNTPCQGGWHDNNCDCVCQAVPQEPDCGDNDIYADITGGNAIYNSDLCSNSLIVCEIAEWRDANCNCACAPIDCSDLTEKPIMGLLLSNSDKFDLAQLTKVTGPDGITGLNHGVPMGSNMPHTAHIFLYYTKRDTESVGPITDIKTTQNSQCESGWQKLTGLVNDGNHGNLNHGTPPFNPIFESGGITIHACYKKTKGGANYIVDMKLSQHNDCSDWDGYTTAPGPGNGNLNHGFEAESQPGFETGLYLCLKRASCFFDNGCDLDVVPQDEYFPDPGQMANLPSCNNYMIQDEYCKDNDGLYKQLNCPSRPNPEYYSSDNNGFSTLMVGDPQYMSMHCDNNPDFDQEYIFTDMHWCQDAAPDDEQGDWSGWKVHNYFEAVKDALLTPIGRTGAPIGANILGDLTEAGEDFELEYLENQLDDIQSQAYIRIWQMLGNHDFYTPAGRGNYEDYMRMRNYIKNLVLHHWNDGQGVFYDSYEYDSDSLAYYYTYQGIVFFSLQIFPCIHQVPFFTIPDIPPTLGNPWPWFKSKFEELRQKSQIKGFFLMWHINPIQASSYATSDYSGTNPDQFDNEFVPFILEHQENYPDRRVLGIINGHIHSENGFNNAWNSPLRDYPSLIPQFFAGGNDYGSFLQMQIFPEEKYFMAYSVALDLGSDKNDTVQSSRATAAGFKRKCVSKQGYEVHDPNQCSRWNFNGTTVQYHETSSDEFRYEDINQPTDCNSGYQSTGNAYHWECASGCAGGIWSDIHCSCACQTTVSVKTSELIEAISGAGGNISLAVRICALFGVTSLMCFIKTMIAKSDDYRNIGDQEEV